MLWGNTTLSMNTTTTTTTLNQFHLEGSILLRSEFIKAHLFTYPNCAVVGTEKKGKIKSRVVATKVNIVSWCGFLAGLWFYWIKVKLAKGSPLLVLGVGDRVRHLRGGTTGVRLSMLRDCVDSAPPIIVSTGVAGDAAKLMLIGVGIVTGTGAGTGWTVGLLIIMWLLLLLILELLLLWCSVEDVVAGEPFPTDADREFAECDGSGGSDASKASRASSGLLGLKLCGVSMSTEPESTLEPREFCDLRSWVIELVVPATHKSPIYCNCFLSLFFIIEISEQSQ